MRVNTDPVDPDGGGSPIPGPAGTTLATADDPPSVAHVHWGSGRAQPGCTSICGYTYRTETEPTDVYTGRFCSDCLLIKVTEAKAALCACDGWRSEATA